MKPTLARVCLIAVAAFLSCKEKLPPFSVSHIDRTVRSSRYPVPADPTRVGTYAGSQSSGAGYFYDDVLEYRVWLHPENGAAPLAGDQDYFAAFATYESALEFADANKGAERPLVLVFQREHVNEPQPGRYVWVKEQRTTEWKPEWLLQGTHRRPNSITNFLSAHSIAQK